MTRGARMGHRTLVGGRHLRLRTLASLLTSCRQSIVHGLTVSAAGMAGTVKDLKRDTFMHERHDGHSAVLAMTEIARQGVDRGAD